MSFDDSVANQPAVMPLLFAAELQDHLHRLERQNAEILSLLRDAPRLRAA